MSRKPLLRAVQLIAAAAVAALLLGQAGPAPANANAAPVAGGWVLVKFPQGQPVCTGVGFRGALYFDRFDCGFGWVGVSETTPSSSVTVAFFDASGLERDRQLTTFRAAEEAWQFSIFRIGQIPTAWAPGVVTIRVVEVDPDGSGPEPPATGNFGEATYFLNQLGADVQAAPKPGGGEYAPGEEVPVEGNLYELDQPVGLDTEKTNVSGTYSLRVVTPSGDVRGPYGPFTADKGGTGKIAETLPADATAGLTATAESNFEVAVAVEVIDADYDDPVTGAWTAERAGAGQITLRVPPDTLVVENSYVSAVGWVKPGESYPFRVFVKNFTTEDASDAAVTIPPVDGTTFTNVTPLTGSGTATIQGDGSILWTVGSVAAGTDAGPKVKTLVVEARADTLGQDPQIVWKNLSTTAELTYTGGPAGLESTSLGPKVIPPKETFDTARYGFRPFPVVPVDYFERKHEEAHTGDRLSKVINSPNVPGSTFNLYQEMSYGQLAPNGAVPSAAVATAGWDVTWNSARYKEGGFAFTEPQPTGACTGTTYKDFRDTALYPERIRNGWYQLPGDTQYYGADQFSAGSLAGAIAGIGLLFQIDNACGPTGKAVYDAAHIADPEIDYSDYDTDKDGVVDFFMMVFVGAGGNGVSQTSVPPYDNIWPHSSSLEFYFTDPETGLKGYVSDDQLADHQGRPLYFTDASRSAMTTTETDFPVYVRVGPYNVNPESAIERASVISHEYGHSLGLPDFYSLGSRETYGTWNLMASDHSQHMTVFSKQELGWIVPRVLEPGETTLTEWADSKLDTHRIDWQQRDGTRYTLTGPSVHNGEAYVAKLPGRRVFDPAKFDAAGPGEGATPDHVWWSRSGNDFGCTPQGAHNLDIALPELATLPAGTTVTATYKSYWNIEWDFDYGFTMVSTDGGETYRSLPSQRDYTTAAFNPNANSCQTQYGNGLTGTSGSYEAGSQEADRLLGEYPDGGFLLDEYDLSSAVGSQTVLRFSYSTDAGLARPGWFVDDLRITATLPDGGTQVIYETDFETSGDPGDPRVFNGGCKDSTRTAAFCTAGWQYVSASAASTADHAYYLEMRDRSGFDLDGKGQSDRGDPTFSPGLALEYTDEAHGYGNVGTDDPPAQHILDSVPQPGNRTPNLDDAAFTATAGDAVFSDAPPGHVDNYTDPARPDERWRFDFGCLGFRVDAMSGEGVGPATAPGDLVGDVTFTIGAGCAAFDYGFDVPNGPPTAVAQAKPTEVDAGEEVTFDGSASFDDVQPASELDYEWDFEGDGTFDANGQTVTHAYDAAGTYEATLRVTDAGGLSDTDSVTVTVRVPPADLQVTKIEAVNNRAREGEKVTIEATVTNASSGPAGASQTEFLLDGATVLGLVDTPALGSNQSAVVSVEWDTRAVKGEHTITVTADKSALVDESNEDNNAATLTVTVRGNKVTNGSFEQASASGSGPEAWSGESTGAGDAAWSDGGSDGEKSASFTGTGRSVALFGSPTWTSDPFAVTPGEVIDLVVSVNASDASSATTASLALLDAAGTLLNTLTLITAPLTTDGFQTLEQSVTVPDGVAEARVVLTGFSPLDAATAGTITFDDVGVFTR
jgi:immune inhibitor A